MCNTHFVWLKKSGYILTKISDPGGFSCRVKVEDVDASSCHHLNMRGNSTINRTRRKGDPCCRSLSCVRRVRAKLRLLVKIRPSCSSVSSRVYLSIQQRSSWCPRIRPGSDLHVPSLELAFKELEHMLLIHHFDKGFPRETTGWWRDARKRRAVLRFFGAYLNCLPIGNAFLARMESFLALSACKFQKTRLWFINKEICHIS